MVEIEGRIFPFMKNLFKELKDGWFWCIEKVLGGKGIKPEFFTNEEPLLRN